MSEYANREVTIVVPEGDWTYGQNVAVSGLQSGDGDLAFLSWAAYFVAFDNTGAQPGLNVVRNGQPYPYYESQVLTYSGSGITTLEDLAGGSLCWADWFSVSGHMIPSYMLEEVGVEPHPGDETYSNHTQVIWNLYNHTCYGGGTYVDARIADGLPSDVMDVVIPIAISPPVPYDGFAFRDGLSEETRNQLINAILEVNNTQKETSCSQFC